MSLPSDVVDKLQQYVDEVFDKIKETAQSLVPDLPPTEQKKTAFIQTNSVYARCFLRSGIAMCGNAPLHHSMNQSVLYAYDVNVTKDTVRFSGLTKIGKINGTNWENLNPAEVVYVEDDLIGAWTTEEHFWCEIPHSGEMICTIPTGHWNRQINVKSHDAGVDYGIYQSFHDTWGGNWQGGYLDIQVNAAEYVESGGYVSITFTDTTTTLYSLYPNSSVIYAQKGYPFVGNMKDTGFINQYVTDNNTTNNYHTTYTTPTNKNIEIYYGDNYVIYYVEDDEPVSYDDVKNAFNIAINQINDDNDADINVPEYPVPPEPEPVTDDDYIDMGLGVETDGMAMYNMAVLTRDELIQLIGDFETNADTGLSFLPHVLGLYKLGIESSQLLTTKSDTINFHKEPKKTAFISNDNYNIVDEQLQVIDCGSITVDREELLTNTYLDYSPYSTYEMFIPACGWITLPDTVVGRTISVHIVFDLTTCSCKGVVRSESKLLGGSGSTLATVNGIIGSSVPLSINETGLQRGAIMNGAVQTVTALATTGMGIGIGNPYMGMSGLAMAAGSLTETHIAGNATYTSTKGGATDYSVFGDGYKAVLKITRPKLEIPDNYGHTVGYVVNKYDTLGNYSGFTVCLNPHITGLTCTSDEKEEIARLLERGVILPAGE